MSLLEILENEKTAFGEDYKSGLSLDFYQELGDKLDVMQMELKRGIYTPIQMALKEKKLPLMELTLGEIHVVVTLYHKPNLCVGELSRSSGITNITKILNSLEDKGYIERSFSHENRRNTILSLTAAGRKLIDDSDFWTTRLSKALLDASLTTAEQTELMSLTNKMMRILVKINREPDTE